MANRSGSERAAGRGLPRQPPGLVGGVARDLERLEGSRSDGDDDDTVGGPIDLGNRSSAWERMLETLGDEDVGGLEDGLESLHASIAERLRAVSPAAEGARAPLRSARRRRR
jgi:hypothetical protein